MAEITITGDKKLQRQFESLKGGAQRRIMRPAIRTGGKPVVKDARNRVPVDEGLLKKSIGTQLNSYKDGTIIIRIGARSRMGGVDIDGRFKKPHKYAHLIELGTIYQGAQPFLRPALDSNKSRSVQLIRGEVGKRIAKELAKAK